MHYVPSPSPLDPHPIAYKTRLENLNPVVAVTVLFHPKPQVESSRVEEKQNAKTDRRYPIAAAAGQGVPHQCVSALLLYRIPSWKKKKEKANKSFPKRQSVKRFPAKKKKIRQFSEKSGLVRSFVVSSQDVMSRGHAVAPIRNCQPYFLLILRFCAALLVLLCV